MKANTFFPRGRAWDSADEGGKRCRAARSQPETGGERIKLDKAPGISSTGVAPEDFRRIKNPMNDDQVILRPCLLSGLLKALASNLRAGAKSVRLFEIGRVFAAKAPEEFAHFGVLLSGPVAERTWRSGQGSDSDLFDLKGVVASVLEGLLEFAPAANPALDLALEIKIAGRAAGIAGQLWPKDARALDTEARGSNPRLKERERRNAAPAFLPECAESFIFSDSVLDISCRFGMGLPMNRKNVIPGPPRLFSPPVA